jgi:hypothetical protein
LYFGQQRRKSFGFSYRTKVGNDTQGMSLGYKIHLVYDALAKPSSRSMNTYSDGVNTSDFTWDITTKKREVSGHSPTAHVVLDSRAIDPTTLAGIEDILYGSSAETPRLLTPQELIAIFDIPLEFSVDSLGGGKYKIGGPGDIVTDLGLGMSVVTEAGVVSIGSSKYTVTS